MSALDEVTKPNHRLYFKENGTKCDCVKCQASADLASLRAEIDKYEKICTEVRNELTDAGIPELTEDKLSVLPLAKRVALLRAENAKLREFLPTSILRKK